MDGWFEAEQVVNYATAAVERWRTDNPDAEPGTVVFAVNTKDGD
jgi:hypothetical protein